MTNLGSIRFHVPPKLGPGTPRKIDHKRHLIGQCRLMEEAEERKIDKCY